MRMNSINQDKLFKIDFDAAYPETPACIHEAICFAEKEIHQRENSMRTLRRLAGCAAAGLIILVGIAAAMFSISNKNSEDIVSQPVLISSGAEDADDVVYASKNDPYYHRDAHCSIADENVVELPLITAIEFEKESCPRCSDAE